MQQMINPDQLQKDALQFKDDGIKVFKDVDTFIRVELPTREPIIPGVIFGVPLVLSMLIHIIEFGDFAIIALENIFFALAASILLIALRQQKLAQKIIVSIVTLNILRVIAPISAFKLLVFAILPWLLQAVLEELKEDITDDKASEEEEKKKKAQEEAAKKAAEEADRLAKQLAGEEAKRKAAEKELENERARQADAEKRRLEEQKEAERLRQEADAKRQQEDAEKQRQAEADAKKRRQEEADAEKKRQLEADAERKRQKEEEEKEAERKRLEEEEKEKEAERLRREEEDAERLRQDEEAERLRQEEEAEKLRQEQEAEKKRRELEESDEKQPTVVVAPAAPKPTKKYIEERKKATINVRETLDLKGDRAYEYLIKRFRKHALGRFFEGDYFFSKNEEQLYLDNMEVLLAKEDNFQIWTHVYSTKFDFVFPEALWPSKGKLDISWEIDTFLLYAAMCRILSRPNETQTIFKHYNALQTKTEKNVKIEDGHEGVEIVWLPGENQPYLVRYNLQIQYVFDANENKYIDFLNCRGMVEFKISPYVGLRDVNLAFDAGQSQTVQPTRQSLRMSTPSQTESKPQRLSFSTTPQQQQGQPAARPGSAMARPGSSAPQPSSTRQNDISSAFVDSSLKK